MHLALNVEFIRETGLVLLRTRANIKAPVSLLMHIAYSTSNNWISSRYRAYTSYQTNNSIWVVNETNWYLKHRITNLNQNPVNMLLYRSKIWPTLEITGSDWFHKEILILWKIFYDILDFLEDSFQKRRNESLGY